MVSGRQISILAVAMRCLSRRPVMLVHAKHKDGRRELAGQSNFVKKVLDLAGEAGMPFAFAPHGLRPFLARRGLPVIHLYVTLGRPPSGPGVLVASPAYLNGFWYLDPLGHRDAPTIAEKTFDPETIDASAAAALFQKLRRRCVDGRKTTRAQPEARMVQLPAGAIAIMLQFHKPDERPRNPVCSEVEMIRAVVASRGARPVVIKTHPHGVAEDVAQEIARQVTADPMVLHVNAHVHDILSTACAVCTYNSAAGFEGLLHKVPTLLFADADYHHAAVRVRDLADLPGIFSGLEMRRFEYAKYVHWFVRQNLFHLDQPDCEERIRQVLARVMPGEDGSISRARGSTAAGSGASSRAGRARPGTRARTP